MLQSDTIIVAPASVPNAAFGHIDHIADTFVVSPYHVSVAAPNGVHLSGSEEDDPISTVSEECGDICTIHHDRASQSGFHGITLLKSDSQTISSCIEE